LRIFDRKCSFALAFGEEIPWQEGLPAAKDHEEKPIIVTEL
jgi:hypothetical protein